MSSVRTIARQVGVSAATVSRALNNSGNVAPELRRRIMGAMNRSRYVPKVGLRSAMNVALVYTGESSMGSPFDSALLAGMSEGMEEHGLDLMILNLSGRMTDAAGAVEDYSSVFMRKGIRGVVLRTTNSARALCRRIAAEGFASVVVGDRFDERNVNYVYGDSRRSSGEAVRHLIDLGHRRIALAVNVVEDSDHADRMAGYREAMESAGLEFDERLVFRAAARREGGVQLIRRMHPGGSGNDRPTAVYIADPMTAVGAMGEAQKMGLRIPGDLSIIGFDDADVRFFMHPHMTAVCQDAASMGSAAVAALRQVMDRTGHGAAVRLALPTVFEVHGSTGPVDAQQKPG